MACTDAENSARSEHPPRQTQDRAAERRTTAWVGRGAIAAAASQSRYHGPASRGSLNACDKLRFYDFLSVETNHLEHEHYKQQYNNHEDPDNTHHHDLHVPGLDPRAPPVQGGGVSPGVPLLPRPHGHVLAGAGAGPVCEPAPR